MKNLQGCRQQLGQAMTEMVVASAFVVVPLFLIVPMVGKYIDMKHAAVSSARYAAWERTVYFNTATLDNQPSGFTGFSAGHFPVKSNGTLASEAQLRIFSEASDPVTGSATKLGREFWTYHNGGSMYSPPLTEKASVNSNQYTPDKTAGIARTLVQGLGSVVSFITGILPFSSSKFDAINMRGATDVSVGMSVEPTPTFTNLRGDTAGLVDTGTQGLTMLAKAGVLSQTWSAGGGAHLQSQAQALAPTKLIGDIFNLISIPGIGSGQDLVAAALLTPEFSSSNLVFGQMDIDALPRDKFAVPEFPAADDPNNSLCNDKGFCRE